MKKQYVFLLLGAYLLALVIFLPQDIFAHAKLFSTLMHRCSNAVPKILIDIGNIDSHGIYNVNSRFTLKKKYDRKLLG